LGDGISVLKGQCWVNVGQVLGERWASVGIMKFGWQKVSFFVGQALANEFVGKLKAKWPITTSGQHWIGWSAYHFSMMAQPTVLLGNLGIKA